MNVLCLGEILMRLQLPAEDRFLQASRFDLFVGGSELNVGIALSQFGHKVRILSALPPKNMLTSRIEGELKSFGIETEFIFKEEGRIGLYFMEKGTSIRGGQIIYDRENSSLNQLDYETIDWDLLFESIDHFHWSGITPALSSSAAKLTQKAIEFAKSKKCTVSCDLHYRKNLWNYTQDVKAIISPMIELSDIVVTDPFTFSNLTDIKITTPTEEQSENPIDFENSLREIGVKFNGIELLGMLVRNIESADSHQLAAAFLQNGEFFKSNKIKVNSIIDRVGGGDAFMAGIIHAYHSKMDIRKLANFSVAASALKHTISGDYLLATVDEIHSLLDSGITGKIQR